MRIVPKKGRDHWKLDADQKLGSIISNTIMLNKLDEFFSGLSQRETLLDVGCGTRPYEPLYKSKFVHAYGFDISFSPHDISRADFIASATSIPLANNCIDCVLCTEVLEHVTRPAAALREMARVLKHGGDLVLTVPLLLALHEEPLDFYRYTVHGLRYLLSSAGFDITSVHTKGDMGAVILSTVLVPWLKLWHIASKRLDQPWIYSSRNPVLRFTVVLPQSLYLVWFRFAQKRPLDWAGKLYRRLEYSTPGYIVFAKRPMETQT